MKYNFDQNPPRIGTNSMKWDVQGNQLPMWVADMDFATAPCVTQALVKRAKHPIYGYTVVPDAWYKAIVAWWKRRHGYKIKAEWLQFCTGVVPAISCLVQRFSNVGDNIAVLTPAYDIFFHSVENFGRHVAECKLTYKNGKYALDFDNLEQILANPLTSLLILCNPHNPTGNVWTRDELARIGNLAAKYGVVVISDEIHCDITAPNVNYTPFAAASKVCEDCSITCISASKAFNIAGVQSAAVFVPNPKLRKIAVRGLNSYEIAEPNCFAVDATVAAFTKGEDWLEELRLYVAENRQIACDFLQKNAPKLHLVQAEATYLLWIDCAQITSNTDDLTEFLRENSGLILSTGSQYRGNGQYFLRMNLACSHDRLLDGLKRLVSGLQAYQKR